MANTNGIVVEGLAEFRRAVRTSIGKTPTLFQAGLKAAGVPILAAASARAPRRTGRLSGSLRTSVRGARADIVSSVPYAGGAEWGRFGKWSGFAGAPPRFVVPAVESQLDAAAAILMDRLRDMLEIQGWAHA